MLRLRLLYAAKSERWTDSRSIRHTWSVVAGLLTPTQALAIGLAAQSVKAGKAKALAVVGPTQRSPILPDVPTWSEAGMELNIATWFGLFAPTGTPREAITRLNGELAKGLFNTPAMKEKFLTGLGMAVEPPAGGTPEQLAALVTAEHEKLAKLVKLIGIKPE